MADPDTRFDDEGLRAALKRSALPGGASPQLKNHVASLLRASAPAMATASGRRLGSNSGDRVFGLPRAWGIAAAIAFLVTGGSLITYQLSSQFPSHVARVDVVQQVIASLVQVHSRSPDAAKVSTDLGQFQRSLPSAMPLASLSDPKATFVGARLDQLDGQLCYAVQYLIDGRPFTLVTSAVKIGYQVPKYNQVEGRVRLVGGERDGYLVCLMGESKVPEATYQSLFADVRLLPSPSTQPVTSAVVSAGLCQ